MRRPLVSLRCLAAAAWLVLAGTVAVRGADVAEAGYVSKADTLPNEVVRSPGEMAQIKPLLAKLPDGHRLRLEFVTAYTVQTGKEADERSVRLATMVDAKDRPDGLELAFVGHRVVRATEFARGERQGVERLYDVDSGKLQAEVPWQKGAVHGVKRTFHPNGEPASETSYERGVIVGQSRSFDPEGRLLRTVTYVDGGRHGDSIDYWPEKPDVVQRIVPYRKNLVDGVAKAFYLSGQLKWERPFRNNRQHGIEKQYAGDGTLEKTVFWLDGNPVPEAEYRAGEK